MRRRRPQRRGDPSIINNNKGPRNQNPRVPDCTRGLQPPPRERHCNYARRNRGIRPGKQSVRHSKYVPIDVPARLAAGTEGAGDTYKVVLRIV